MNLHGAARAVASLAALLAAGSAAHAQRRPAVVDASITAGTSLVRYDGFLPSGAVSVAPALTVTSGRASLAGGATALLFQSGSQSLSGYADGAWTLASVPHLGRLALDGSGGASEYAVDYGYAHALFGGRLTAAAGDALRGATFWAGARSGVAWSHTPFESGRSATRRAGTEASGGAGVRVAGLALRGTLSAQRFGPSNVEDAALAGEWRRGRLAADALVGARHGGLPGEQGFAEAGVAMRASPAVLVQARGGRYVSDPIRGMIAGRFAELSVRIALGRRRSGGGAPSAGASGAFTRLGFEVRRLRGGERELRVRVPGASRVEIMADFTSWEPVALRSAGDEQWALAALVPPGVHRVNVRIDGGAWTVPPGLTAVADEFGGAVGLLVVE